MNRFIITATMKLVSWLDPLLEIFGKRKLITKTIRQTRWLLIPCRQLYSHLCPFSMYQSLSETTQSFCTVPDFLQLGFWNRVMLHHDYNHHSRSFYSRGFLWCIHFQHESKFVYRVKVNISSFVYSRRAILWATRQLLERSPVMWCSWPILQDFRRVWVARLLLFLFKCYFWLFCCLRLFYFG